VFPICIATGRRVPVQARGIFLQLVGNIPPADAEVLRRYRHLSQSAAVDLSAVHSFYLSFKTSLLLLPKCFGGIPLGLWCRVLSYHANLRVSPTPGLTKSPNCLSSGNCVFSSRVYVLYFIRIKLFVSLLILSCIFLMHFISGT